MTDKLVYVADNSENEKENKQNRKLKRNKNYIYELSLWSWKPSVRLAPVIRWFEKAYRSFSIMIRSWYFLDLGICRYPEIVGCYPLAVGRYRTKYQN